MFSINATCTTNLLMALFVGMCCLLHVSCRDDQGVHGYGAIEPGRWCLVIKDSADTAIPGAEVTLRGQPQYNNQVIPVDGYSGPGSLVSDADGIVCLSLSRRVPFGVVPNQPSLDNTVHIEADGFIPVEFSFSDLTFGKVGTPVSALGTTVPASASRPANELQARYYSVILQRR